MNIGSLFSGIGGLELGLEWAGLGPVMWQVEKDPFCRSVLAKHWPHVPRYVDVKEVGARQLEAVELICGGFPCQDVSSAGKRAGIHAGTRSGLWLEYRRVLAELRPVFAVVENVGSDVPAWLPQVRRDLHLLGYRTRALGIAARDVGAHHGRARVFVVAHADGQGEPARAQHAEMAIPQAPSWAGGRFTEPDMVRVVPGLSGGLHQRLRGLGNSVVPQCAQIVGQVIRQMTGTRTQ
jgi:DNA (cytosine-5)-methyltransferase 1